MVLYWSLLLTTCVVSLCALVASTRRYGRWKEKKRLDALQLRVLDLEILVEKYEHQVRKLTARVGMREHRAKQKETNTNGGVPDPDTDPERWKMYVSGVKRQ